MPFFIGNRYSIFGTQAFTWKIARFDSKIFAYLNGTAIMNQLFVYGTLCPNRENAHILGGIGGDWQKASVHGTIHILDWGPDKGLPALVLAEQDPLIMGYLFSTEKLEQNWQMLDEFEGFQYERVVAEVILESGEKIDAWTYVMKPQELK